MSIDHTFMIKKLKKCEKIAVLFSAATKLPFVECDEETFDDQVYIFSDPEKAKELAKKYADKKNALVVGMVPKEQIENFFRSLYIIGVTCAIVQDDGDPVRIEVENLTDPPVFDEEQSKTIPNMNPGLQLTTLYFLQELRRPVERTNDEKKALRSLEEEMAVNMFRSRFVVALDVPDDVEWNPNDLAQQVRIPYIKNPDGSLYQPIYTEIGEFKKFHSRQKDAPKKMRLVPLDYDAVIRAIPKNVKGIIINPAGFGMILTRENLEALKKNYYRG